MMKHPEFDQMVALAERLRLELDSSDRKIGKVAHIAPLAACVIHSHPNYALLFGGIRVQRLTVVLLLRLLDTKLTLLL
jgi:hypothetical protein